MTNDMTVAAPTAPANYPADLNQSIYRPEYDEKRVGKYIDEVIAAAKDDRANTKHAISADIASTARVQNQNDRFMDACERELRRKDLPESRREELLADMKEAAASTAYANTASREFQREQLHNWRFRKNGPSDVEMLIKIAKTLGLSDWTLLTKEIDGGNTMTQLTERQKNAAKRIYDVCIWFLSEFSNTDGFNDYWYKFKDAGSTDPEEDIYELVQKKMDKVGMVLDQEYFDLHGHEIYDEFCEFASEELSDTYNGKLSYAYRFEAIPDGHPTTSEDYDRAMKALNAIIDKYL